MLVRDEARFTPGAAQGARSGGRRRGGGSLAAATRMTRTKRTRGAAGASGLAARRRASERRCRGGGEGRSRDRRRPRLRRRRAWRRWTPDRRSSPRAPGARRGAQRSAAQLAAGDRWKQKDPSGAARALDDAAAAAAASLDARAQASWAYVSRPPAPRGRGDRGGRGGVRPRGERRGSRAVRAAARVAGVRPRREDGPRPGARRGRGRTDEAESTRKRWRWARRGWRAAIAPAPSRAWREMLAAHPHGSRWVDTSLRLASALLEDSGAPGADHATGLAAGEGSARPLDAGDHRRAQGGGQRARWCRPGSARTPSRWCARSAARRRTSCRPPRRCGARKAGSTEETRSRRGRISASSRRAQGQGRRADGDACSARHLARADRRQAPRQGEGAGRRARRSLGRSRGQLPRRERPSRRRCTPRASRCSRPSACPKLWTHGGRWRRSFPTTTWPTTRATRRRCRCRAGGDEERAYAMFTSLRRARTRRGT